MSLHLGSRAHTFWIFTSRWAASWACLTAAFALHVLDEATHDFLAWYNPVALGVRAASGQSFFPPVFTFPVWLTGLIAVVLVLAALTPLLRRSVGWLVAAYIYGMIHLLNGAGHIVISLNLGHIAPGALSSPLLIVSAAWLLVETGRVRMAGAA